MSGPLSPDELLRYSRHTLLPEFEQIAALPGVHVRGLMTLAPQVAEGLHPLTLERVFEGCKQPSTPSWIDPGSQQDARSRRWVTSRACQPGSSLGAGGVAGVRR